MPSEKYIIIASGERFVFTRDQLESEPGNYFATYFLGDFKEATNGAKELEIERDPLLFTLIQAHLRGYKVLPIQNDFVPKYMSKSGALENLRRDADFFGLSRLVAFIDEIKRTEDEDERDVESGQPGEKIYRLWSHGLGQEPLKNADGSKWTMAITHDAVQAMFNDQRIVRYYNPQSCEACRSLSKGWQLEAWFSQSELHHFMIESKIV